jgi:hypothetical protein
MATLRDSCYFTGLAPSPPAGGPLGNFLTPGPAFCLQPEFSPSPSPSYLRTLWPPKPWRRWSAPSHPLTTEAFFDRRNEVKVVAKVVRTVAPSHHH